MGGKTMGMTEKHFAGFLRFIIDALIEVKDEEDPERKEKRLESVIEKLQKTIED